MEFIVEAWKGKLGAWPSLRWRSLVCKCIVGIWWYGKILDEVIPRQHEEDLGAGPGLICG